MKIKELVESIKSKDFNIKKELKVKKYIPVMDKKKLAISVLSACTDDFDGFITVDRFKMNICFNMYVLASYTNLEITSSFNEMVEEYDILCEKGIFQKITTLFKEDYDVSYAVLNDELKGLLTQNSIDAQVIKVVNKISDILDIVGEKIENVDFDALLPKGIDIGKMSSILNMLK